jgi:predicted transcriptional regulator
MNNNKRIDLPRFPEDIQYPDRLKGLSLAIHTINQLNDNHYFDITNIANQFNYNEKFVFSVIEFLKEIGWLSEDENGKYIVTEQGQRESSYITDNNT